MISGVWRPTTAVSSRSTHLGVPDVGKPNSIPSFPTLRAAGEDPSPLASSSRAAPQSAASPTTLAGAADALGAVDGAKGKRAGAPRSFTFAEVAAHNSAESCWITMDGRVYDLTPWLDSHPGGREMLLLAAGRECTDLFRMYHWRVAGATGKPGRVEKMMQQLEVGVLAGPTEHPLFAPDTTGFYDELTAAVKGYFSTTGAKPKQRASAARAGAQARARTDGAGADEHDCERARARTNAAHYERGRAGEHGLCRCGVRLVRNARVCGCAQCTCFRSCLSAGLVHALELMRVRELELGLELEPERRGLTPCGMWLGACIHGLRPEPLLLRHKLVCLSVVSHPRASVPLPFPKLSRPPQCGRACGASCCRWPSALRPLP